MGTIFKKPKAPAATAPAAAPAPVADDAVKEDEADNSLKKKKRGKAALMVSTDGTSNTGINI